MNRLAAPLLLLAYLSFLFPQGRRLWQRLAQRLGAWGAFLGLLPVLLAIQGQPPPEMFGRWVVYLALAALLWHWGHARIWTPLLLGLLLWIPLEPELFLLPWGAPSGPQRLLALPEIRAPLGNLTLPLHNLTAVWLALYLVTAYRPLPRVGFTLPNRRTDWRQALTWLALFAVVGFPIGWALGFLRWAPTTPTLSTLAWGALGGYLFTALPEELLFRGLFQNALERILGSRWGLILAAVVFGLSHLDNPTPGFPIPNGAYALMATLAGLAYGSVWQRTHRVTASAITHALVNLLWGWLLGG